MREEASSLRSAGLLTHPICWMTVDNLMSSVIITSWRTVNADLLKASGLAAFPKDRMDAIPGKKQAFMR